jgi:hypothetical protein
MRFNLVVVSCVCILLNACAVMGDRTVNITEAQIQEKLNQRLAVPISLLKLFDVSLSNSVVKFDQTTGRMHTTLDTLLSSQLLNQSVTGKLGISGKLRFDAATHSVMLDEPAIETLDLDGMSGKQKEIVNALAKSIGGDMLNGLTLYTVKPEELRAGTTQYAPKALEITDKGLQITLSPQR